MTTPTVITAPTSQPRFRVVRDRTYDWLTGDEILHQALQLDGDVFEISLEKGVGVTPIVDHKHRLLTNDDFKCGEDLHAFLVEQGKIPAFLELKQSVNPAKGYGIFTKKQISPNTFLGMYEGTYRAHTTNPVLIARGNKYLFTFKDFQTQEKGFIDAENLTFANFTRFVNDGDQPNCCFAQYNYLVYLFSDQKAIEVGDELTAAYGEGYWRAQNQPRQP